MKKRILSCFLAVCMIISLLPVQVIAEELTTQSGTCGENVTWKLENDTLTISGTGAMYDYERDSAPWHDNVGEITSVVVGSGVTSIGNYAFAGCGKLTSAKIPDSVTSIGYSAFEGCNSLTSITIPDSVTSIGGSAFSGCSSLTSITIPDSVTSIGNDAFSDCTGLTEIIVGEHNGAYCSVNGVLFDKSKTKILSYPAGKETEEYVIPDSVTSIGILAFYGCSSLTSITIPDSVTSIGILAFAECSSLTSVTIGNGVTSISDYAFEGCSSLTSVTIPDSVTDIGDGAFSGCSSLTSVTIPDSVISIGEFAFAECSSLASITIPDSVTEIGSYAFSGCSSLTSVTIPDSVTSIGDYAFDACYDLTDVNYSGTIRQWADIVIGEGNTYLTDCDIHCTDGDILVGEYCGKHAKWTLVDGVLTISGKGRMYDYEAPMLGGTANLPPWNDEASSITKVVISEEITYIGSFAFFNCSNLTELTIPSGVTGIGDSFAAGCFSLASISVDENNEHFVVLDGVLFDKEMTTLYYFPPTKTGSYVVPDGVKTIAGYAFSFSTLTDVTVPGSVTEIRTAAFGASEGLTDIKFEQGDPQRAMSIGLGAFMSCGLTSIALPDGVTSIGDYAFYGCANMTNAVLPDSVTSIGDYAFAVCSLTSVTIGNGVTSIGKYAFAECSSLTDAYYSGTIEQWSNIAIDDGNDCLNNCSIHCTDGNTGISWTLDNGTLTISGTGDMCDYYFSENDDGDYVTTAPWGEYYKSIKSVVIENGVTSIGDYAFAACSSLTSVTIPDSVTSIGDYAFAACSSLTSVTIPDGVTSIGEGAFGACSSLTSVTIPDSVTSIGDDAFYACSNIEKVYYTGNVSSWLGIDFKGFTSNPYCDGNLYFNGKLLTDVVIPNGITSIGNYAFKYCSSLTSVTIPNSVTSIGKYAFYDCSSLTSVTIGNGVTSIGDYTFDGCSSLKDVYYSGTLAEWSAITVLNGNDSLKNASLHCTNGSFIDYGECGDDLAWGLDSNGTLIISGTGAMNSYSNSKNTDGDYVTTAPWKNYYKSIKSVVIEDGVTNVGNYAFYGFSSLTSVTIGNGVTSIGNLAFESCNNIKDVYYTGDVSSWLGISFSNYSSNPCSYGANLYFNGELVTDVVIPEGATSIGNYAFRNCSSLTSVTIPNSVTSIGSSAFYGCDSLKDVYYSGTLAEWSAITVLNGNDSLKNATLNCTNGSFIDYGKCGDSLTWGLDSNGTLLVSGTDAMYNYSFDENADGVYVTTAPWENCYMSIKSVVIEDGVTSIGYSAFYGFSSLTSVTIGNGVTSIGNYAFYNCSSLTSVTIPDSVTSIGNYAFYGCSKLMTVNYSGTVKQWGNIEIDNYNEPLTLSFIRCTDGDIYPHGNCGDNVTWSLLDGVLTISGEGRMDDAPWEGAPEKIKQIVIGDGVTSIGNSAFGACSSLTSVTIPDSVTSIGDYAFINCSSLTSVTIPDSVTSIGEGAFGDCSSLTSVTIPDSVTSIGNGAFSDCTGLTEIIVGEHNGAYCSVNGVLFDKSKTKILSYPAGKEMEEYIIPDSVTSIGDEAFCGCSSLTSMTIPDSITSIGYSAFAYCDSLVNVTIPDSVTSIGGSAFYGCSSLTSVTIPDSVTSIDYSTFYGCSSLTSVTMGIGVTSIESNAFSKCQSLKYVYYGGAKEQWAKISISSGNDILKSASISYAHAHSYTDTVTEPNCTEKGYTTHTCDCGYSYKDSYVAALGHDYGEWAQTKEPNCTEKGSETRSCSRCNAVETRSIAATGHHYTDTVTEPNCTEKGYTTHTCDCGHSYKDSYVDALGHSYENGKCTRCGAVDPSTVEINAGKLTVSGESGRYGDEVTVSVSISDNPGFNSMKLALSYDKSKLQLIGCEDAGLKGWSVSDDLTWSGSDDTNYNGVIVKLKFKILEGCDIGDAQVAVSYSSGDIRNKATERICPEVINGKVTVWCPVAGDLNGDDIVNALDLLILKKYLGDNNIQLAGNGDFNGDGVIDELDLTMLKRFLAGDDVQLH